MVEVSTRPVGIVWYERLAWVAVAGGLISTAADQATFAKYYDPHPISYPILVVCVFALQLLWIWLIARRRRNWARWISVIVVIAGIPQLILDFDQRVRLNAAAAIAYYGAFVISAIAVSLLFRHDAREWFSHPPSPLNQRDSGALLPASGQEKDAPS